MFGQKSASTTVTVYIHFDITCNHTQTHCQRAISTNCQTHFMDNLRYTNFLDDAFTTCLRSVWDLLHSNITVHDKRSITDLHWHLYSTAMLLGSPKKKKKKKKASACVVCIWSHIQSMYYSKERMHVCVFLCIHVQWRMSVWLRLILLGLSPSRSIFTSTLSLRLTRVLSASASAAR